jgi:hypothetical protein
MSMQRLILAALVLSLSSVASAASKPSKPSVCADFRTYESAGQAPIGLCYDSKKPAVWSSWTIVTVDGQRYAVGFRA